MKSMGVDLSTKTGIAVLENVSKLILASEYEFPKLQGHARQQAIAETVLEQVRIHSPDVLMIEGTIHGSKFVSSIQQDLAAVVRYVLYQNEVEYLDVSPSTLKKFVTGSGNAKKELMMLQIHVQWGIKTSTNNIADAVALAMFGQGFLKHPMPAAKLAVINDYRKSIAKNNAKSQ